MQVTVGTQIANRSHMRELLIGACLLVGGCNIDLGPCPLLLFGEPSTGESCGDSKAIGCKTQYCVCAQTSSGAVEWTCSYPQDMSTIPDLRTPSDLRRPRDLTQSTD
jgi:hypothetical protein